VTRGRALGAVFGGDEDAYVVTDRAGVAPGPGCEVSDAETEPTVVCVAPPIPLRARVRLGDRDDEARLDGAEGLVATVFGGPGADFLAGPEVNQEFGLPPWVKFHINPRPRPRLAPALALATGRTPGSTLLGGPGSDIVFGGPGDDTIVPGPGVDYIDGSRGDDRVNARDRTLDWIECQRRGDHLMLDRFDFPRGRCRVVRRRGAPFVLPLYVLWSESSGETLIWVGCPSDRPTPCRGEVAVSIKGGRRVFAGRFSVGVGKVDGPTANLTKREGRALLNRGAIVSVGVRDARGQVRTLSRITPVEDFDRGGG
jgi:hypothetical protein